MTRTIVVALGGNALAPADEPATISNQFSHTRSSLAPIVNMAAAGWRIAIVHGNGPQVGAALERNEISAARGIEPLPLGVLVAGTAGWIGYMIQQSLENALARANVERRVVTVITQVVCDPNDPALHRPSKPIGMPMNDDRARALEGRGIPVRQEQSGQWRRLAASPAPTMIVEREMVADLVKAGHIVVACGGGGTPVYRDPERGWEGLDAVIDKDLAAAVLGDDIDADVLLILTDVDGVYRNYGTPNAERIDTLSVAEARDLLDEGALGDGSMAPKMRAAVRFARRPGRRAIISGLDRGMEALAGQTGTTIRGDET